MDTRDSGNAANNSRCCQRDFTVVCTVYDVESFVAAFEANFLLNNIHLTRS